MHVQDLYSGMPDVEALCKGDFVLGPVATRDVEVMLQMIEGRVPLISHLDQKAASLSTLYSSFIQAPAGTENQYEDLAQWIQDDLADSDKVLFVSEKNASNVQAPVNIRTALARRGIEYQILSYALADGRAVPDSLSRTLVKKGGVNRVVVASESEPFVGDVVRNLGIMLGKGYDIVMYAPSKVRGFDSIDGSALHAVSSHISTAYHVNYGSPEVDAFVHAYRALFRIEHAHTAPIHHAMIHHDNHPNGHALSSSLVVSVYVTVPVNVRIFPFWKSHLSGHSSQSPLRRTSATVSE